MEDVVVEEIDFQHDRLRVAKDIELFTGEPLPDLAPSAISVKPLSFTPRGYETHNMRSVPNVSYSSFQDGAKSVSSKISAHRLN